MAMAGLQVCLLEGETQISEASMINGIRRPGDTETVGRDSIEPTSPTTFGTIVKMSRGRTEKRPSAGVDRLAVI